MTDYHLHTNFSPDSSAPMEEMAAKAVELGLEEIAFTDHCDFLSFPSDKYDLPDYGAYVKELHKVKEKFPKLRIVFGTEIGIGTHIVKEIEKLTTDNNFEFIIGSIHDVLGKDIYFPEKSGTTYYDGKTKTEVYNNFLEYTLESIKAVKNFHVLGHLDSIERYGPYTDKRLLYADYSEIIDKILLELISSGRGIEVNTSGMKYGLNHFHPQTEIIQKYHDLGGEIITVGSDAHKPAQLAAYLKEATELLKQCGFSYVTSFFQGKAVQKKI